ncbi:MAG: hypothetical protein GYA55_04170 [SAR324 cluster bacterium]|uniref:Uncharacterized protein n=1 Tax=SAR324 cluster bacterium TaxID=2024889 RepID=A0A7X9FQB1_9DELT|nr:hypothetical protein [SAR324 cluster bacterium]
MIDEESTNSDEISGTPSIPTFSTMKASDSVSQFLQSLKNQVDPLTAKASLRVTPHGVFVEKTFLPSFFSLYQNWFKEKLGHEAGLSEQKCMKKFFNTPNPPLYYLVEAKQCMIGHLVKREYADPQRLGLPCYLGSVDDTRRMLHPRDPLLMYMSNLQSIQGSQGREFILQTAKGKWTFSEKVLVEFARVLQRSPKLSLQFPEYSGALRDSFKVLASVLERARLAPPSQRLLVPHAYRSRKDLNYIAMGGLTFVVEGKTKIIACYEVGGRTLFRFIKMEFALLHRTADKRHRNSVEILPPQNRELALIQARGRTYSLHPRGFIEFVRAIMHSSIEGSALDSRYSVKDCLDEFTRALQNADPIENNKVSRHLGRIRTNHPHCLITSRWIFVSTLRNRLIACVDRFHSTQNNVRPRHFHRDGRPHGNRLFNQRRSKSKQL